MRQYLIRIGIVMMAFFSFQLKAQDPQFSQNYAIPNLISPAFAGLEGRSKVNFLYRNQWPNLSSNYVFSGLSLDLALERFQSGLGLILTNDTQFSNLVTNSAGLQYAYHLNLDGNSTLSMGISGAYVSRKIDGNGFFFQDQARNIILGDRPGISTDPILYQLLNSKNYIDLGSGVLYTNQNSWFGLSVQHLNQANQSLSEFYPNRLSPKFSLQMGTKILLEDSFYEPGNVQAQNIEKSISPVLHFKKQGNFTQMDIGTYFNYAPLILGAWYRGLPIQTTGSVRDQKIESIILLAGYRKDNFSIGYSYDLTLSNLGPSTGGAHELSIAYLFDINILPKKLNGSRLRKRSLACPKF